MLLACCDANTCCCSQEDAFGRVNAETGETLGVEEGQLHHLAQLLDAVLAAAHVAVRHVWLLLNLRRGLRVRERGLEGDFKGKGCAGWAATATCIIVTEGSILAGRGSMILYVCLSTPTRMPSSTSVDATLSPRATTNFAYWRMLMTYLVGLGGGGGLGGAGATRARGARALCFVLRVLRVRLDDLGAAGNLQRVL
jgi:hypothetical protein